MDFIGCNVSLSKYYLVEIPYYDELKIRRSVMVLGRCTLTNTENKLKEVENFKNKIMDGAVE